MNKRSLYEFTMVDIPIEYEGEMLKALDILLDSGLIFHFHVRFMKDHKGSHLEDKLDEAGIKYKIRTMYEDDIEY